MNDPAPSEPQPLWIVDATVAAEVMLPSGEAAERDRLFEWLWEAWQDRGLVGVNEGTLDVADAVAAGVVDTPRVVDAAAAPADRDWVRDLPVATVEAWFDGEEAAWDAAAALAGVGGCEVRGVRPASRVADESWRAGFGPVEVPGFGVIRPAWEPGAAEWRDAAATIFIEPGAGFGTGLHETTRLCLAAIAAWRAEGGAVARVLDFGSGSGILGIAAAVGGAGHVDAIEIDGRVHEAIRGNAARNGAAGRLTVAADMPAGSEPHDLVLANIVAPVLVDRADMLCGRLRRAADVGLAGCLVLSGLLADDVPRVAEAFAARLATRPIATAAGDWHCLRFGTGPRASPVSSAGHHG